MLELIPASPLAACGILGKSPVCLSSLSSQTCPESKSVSLLFWVTEYSMTVEMLEQKSEGRVEGRVSVNFKAKLVP